MTGRTEDFGTSFALNLRGMRSASFAVHGLRFFSMRRDCQPTDHEKRFKASIKNMTSRVELNGNNLFGLLIVIHVLIH